MADSSIINKEEAEKPLWFAMRVTYRRELILKAQLEEAGFQVFIPMVMTEKVDSSTHRKRRVEAPAIHNLLFVLADPIALQKFKQGKDSLQYICTKEHTEKSKKIIIPQEQMEAFIRLYQEGTAQVIEEKELLPGTKVRVISGPFAGMTGIFQRINGHRNRYFVITLEGLISIGSTLIRPEMVEEIHD